MPYYQRLLQEQYCLVVIVHVRGVVVQLKVLALLRAHRTVSNVVVLERERSLCMENIGTLVQRRQETRLVYVPVVVVGVRFAPSVLFHKPETMVVR